MSRKTLSRRGFLDVTGKTAVATLLGSLLEFVPEVQAQTSYYYGTDTNTLSDPEIPQNFYIGRTGVGELIYTTGFNQTAAQRAGRNKSHSYWVLKGPYYKYRGNRTPYDYGRAQATKAGNAWYDHIYAADWDGKTVFADIEEAGTTDPELDDGWTRLSDGYINQADNRAVLNGFLDGIVNFTRNGTNPGLNPGVYITPGLWESWFGTSYLPSRSFVLWLAGCGNCGSICPPCSTSCSSTMTDAANRFNTRRNTILGKCKTIIWQYWLNPGCTQMSCGDYNIASQSGNISFSPVTDSVIYQASCS